MAPKDDYFVKGRGSVGTRRAGTGAREMARAERKRAPIGMWVARALGAHSDERAWRRGAEGEERVGSSLARLPDGWHVFHDLSIGTQGANIDHLVIGPGGVFTLNTKNLKGNLWVGERTVLVDGRKTAFLRKAVGEAAFAADRLTAATGRAVIVHPVLVVFAARITRKGEPSGVSVVEGSLIRKWLEQRPHVLGESEAVAIARMADDPAAWD